MKGVTDSYLRNVAQAKQQLARLSRSVQINALLRLMTVVGCGVLLFRAAQTEQILGVWATVLGGIVLFMGLVRRQSQLEARRQAWEAFAAVNQNELDIQEGRSNRYADGQAYADAVHPYSGDLDVFGPGSLFAKLNRCATLQGNERLAAWLAEPADADTVARRQDTVRELALDAGWCQQWQAGLWFLVHRPQDFQAQLTRLLDSKPASFDRRVVRTYVRLAPWLMLSAGSMAVVFPTLRVLAIALGLIHLIVVLAFGREIERTAGQVERTGQLLNALAASFRLLERRSWQSSGGQTLQATVSKADGQAASVAVNALADIADRLDYRLNMLVAAVLRMVALWDFRQVFAVADWRRQHRDGLLDALDAVAEAEALVSLATLARNHPHWTFPVVVGSTERVMEATGLAHPLLTEEQAVPNDYRMHGHRVALITGSNMAGKSTFLRTVGSNAVLAYCGAPVCAGRLRLSVFRLVTYMRIADSLQEGTSTFKAELERIQQVLQTVRRHADAYFLIDEMLRGTNSTDKYLGSKAIIEQLIRDGGAGLVATHDLQLARLAETWPGVLANFHFDIQVEEGEMRFDYRLKPGECTVFNASLLLKRIGIDPTA